MFLFIIIEVVRGFKNIEVASSLSTEMCVYVCVARIACAADQPTNRDAGRSRGRAAGRGAVLLVQVVMMQMMRLPP